MKNTLKKAACILLSVSLLLSFSACKSSGTQSSTTASNTKTGGTVTIDRNSDTYSLDPARGGDNWDIFMVGIMMEGLVKTSNDGKKIEPCLADSWTISSDGLTYTFKLKQGVKFSDGNAVTPEDWIYSLKRTRDADDGAWNFILSDMKDVTSTDANTLVITLNSPSGAFLSDLCMTASSVMEKSYSEKAGNAGVALKPIGTGPFMLGEWKKNESMTFVRNPYYRDKSIPKVDKVVFNVVPEENTRVMQLQASQVDAIAGVPFNRVDDLKKAGLKIITTPSTEVRYISLNYRNPKFKDVRVRQALAYATNRDDLNKAIFYGKATKVNTFVAPSMPHFNSKLKSYDYNPTKAKELLKEAGVSNLNLNLIIISGDNEDLQTGTILKSQWAKVGVTLNLVPLDSAARKEQRNNMTYDVLLSLITSDISDTSEVMELMCIKEMNSSMHLGWQGTEQEKAESLVKEASRSMDEKVRMNDYCQAQEIFQNDCPMIPLYLVPTINGTTTKINNFIQTTLGCYRFDSLTKSE